jgi:hypothetical protein
VNEKRILADPTRDRTLEPNLSNPAGFQNLRTEDIPSYHPFGSSAAVLSRATARCFAHSPFDELAFVEDEEVTYAHQNDVPACCSTGHQKLERVLQTVKSLQPNNPT